VDQPLGDGELADLGRTLALAARATLADGAVEVVPDGDGARYRVDGVPPDAALVATVAAWCATADRLILELRTGGGSLEDVYLGLVGTTPGPPEDEP
jgi:hypothetical protein